MRINIMCGWLLCSVTWLTMGCDQGGAQFKGSSAEGARDSVPVKNAGGDRRAGKGILKDTSMVGAFSDQSGILFDSGALDIFFRKHPSLSGYAGDVRQFYRGRKNAFAWYDEGGLIEQAGHLQNMLSNLDAQGLDEDVPYKSMLDSLLGNAGLAGRSAGGDVLEPELLLTSLYFFYAEKVWTGMPEEKTRKIEWFLPRKKKGYAEWLRAFLAEGTGGSAGSGVRPPVEPVYRQYGLLRNFLRRYVDLEKSGGWAALKMERNVYRVGDSARLVREIKRRLYVLGDLPVADSSPLFDAALEAAVKKFQQRFGIKDDGVAGKGFIAELNVPVRRRIDEIRVNMERSRWIPDNVQGDYLAINIPEFKLHLYRDDSLLWDMRVVVGKSVHRTVIFSGLLKNIVFSPYWNVPSGILRSEILPGIRRDKSYLTRHHMEWNGNTVRQKPGPWNSLGLVKFLFPNSYDIYLHDTPSKGLFGESSRAFSHGCIRLAEPEKLADYLLRNDPAWDVEKISRVMHAGKELWVGVKEPFYVIITYFTAWVDRAGQLNFRKDIYGRDQRLSKMLFQ